METEKKEMTSKASPPVSIAEAFFVHLICGLGLALAFLIARHVYSADLISDPSRTLFLILYLKAMARGILGLLAGAIINAFGAIVLGAPIGAHVVPSACVFGSSWMDWQRLFAYTKPNGTIDHMICIPAHGAIIGAWFGAWPMPLDWERPWQEWPICVSYGAVIGYSIAMVASLAFSHARSGLQHVKRD